MADIRCEEHGILVEDGGEDGIVHVPRKDPCSSGEFDVTSYGVDRLVVAVLLSGRPEDRGAWEPAGGHPL